MREIWDAREILTFSWLNEVEVLEGFIRDFYQWELIYENGVMNSRAKSRVQQAFRGEL